MGYTTKDVEGWIGAETLAEWTQLQPTNIPKQHGGYTFTDKDAQATISSGSAAAWIEGKLKNETGSSTKGFGGAKLVGGFWIKLGALTKRSKIGRCLHMSGVAAVDLLSNPKFDNVKITIIGSTAYDHHFVMLDIFNTEREWQRFIVDVWQGRVDQSNTFVYTDATHPYFRHGGLATFFEFNHGAGQRKMHTALIAEAKAVN